MKRPSKSHNELERNASMMDERGTPSREKQKDRPPSLNNVPKNESV